MTSVRTYSGLTAPQMRGPGVKVRPASGRAKVIRRAEAKVNRHVHWAGQELRARPGRPGSRIHLLHTAIGRQRRIVVVRR